MGRSKKDKKEKVIQVTASYHKPCDIEKIGGMVRAREIAKKAVEKEIRRVSSGRFNAV